jgi:hypothetical protein
MKKILWCGDSTVVGRTLKPGTPDLVVSDFNEVKVCADLLTEKLGAGSDVSVSAGAAVQISPNGANGDVAKVIPSFESRMALPENAGVDIVVLQIGIIYAFVPAIGVGDFRWCLQEIYRIVVRIHVKKFLVCTPCPIVNAANFKLWGLQNGMKLVAKNLGVQVIDHYAAIFHPPQTGSHCCLKKFTLVTIFTDSRGILLVWHFFSILREA